MSAALPRGHSKTDFESAGILKRKDQTVNPQCEDCRFFVRWSDTPDGVCHRFPPVPIAHPEGKQSFSTTFTRACAWCGEFISREALESASREKSGSPGSPVSEKSDRIAVSPDDEIRLFVQLVFERLSDGVSAWLKPSLLSGSVGGTQARDPRLRRIRRELRRGLARILRAQNSPAAAPKSDAFRASLHGPCAGT